MLIPKYNVRSTRFPQLGYLQLDRALWRFVDISDGCTDPPRCVGPLYRTRSELLADLDRYASESWGLE